MLLLIELGGGLLWELSCIVFMVLVFIGFYKFINESCIEI